MIYVTGDTHGDIDFKKLDDYFSNRYFTEKDYLFILGDVGMIWGEDVDFISEYRSLGVTIFFIDGNHENFDLLNQFPVTMKFGAKVHYINENIYHVLRGEVLTLNGLSFLCLGGATSIDKALRTPGVSYWAEENIQDVEIENALNNLLKRNNKVDYILTHCCSSDCLRKHFRYKVDENTEKLNAVERVAKFRWWFFGHYHEDAILDNKHRVFYHNIIEIDAPYKGKKSVKDHFYSMDENGRIYDEKGHKTRLKEEDLPEWFYRGHVGYYDLRGLVDVAFLPSSYSNQIDKDSYFALSYDKPIKRDENGAAKYWPSSEKCDYAYSTWRVSLTSFIAAVERYSPNIKFERIKKMINRICDNYYNDPVAWFPYGSFRYYPDIEIPHDPKKPFVLYRNGIVQCEFKEYEVAKKFALKLGDRIGEKFEIKEGEGSLRITFLWEPDVIEIKEVHEG